ncbi:MAG: hypothetical protein JNL28_06565 [Planctomycetes bacterium]|nr:hypothetical protein [Planctomycetota bacterium]
MSTPKKRHVNICQYHVKPGHEAEMEALLAKHWPTLRKAGLASEDPPVIYRGLPSGKPDGEHGAQGVYIEIFSWAQPNGPQIAHQTPEVMAVWEPMGAICKHMEFPLFEQIDPIGKR